MDSETDNTSVDIINLLGSPTPSVPYVQQQQPPRSTEQGQPSEDVLVQSSTELIQTFVASINRSVAEERGKDDAFRQELKKQLFQLIIGAYVWSTARAVGETSTAEGKLAKDVEALLSASREQDLLRARLVDLVATVSRAVEMFNKF